MSAGFQSRDLRTRSARTGSPLLAPRRAAPPVGPSSESPCTVCPPPSPPCRGRSPTRSAARRRRRGGGCTTGLAPPSKRDARRRAAAAARWRPAVAGAGAWRRQCERKWRRRWTRWTRRATAGSMWTGLVFGAVRTLSALKPRAGRPGPGWGEARGARRVTRAGRWRRCWRPRCRARRSRRKRSSPPRWRRQPRRAKIARTLGPARRLGRRSRCRLWASRSSSSALAMRSTLATTSVRC